MQPREGLLQALAGAAGKFAGHFLEGRGLTNYWGCSSIGYLAPESRYSSSGTAGQQVAEFKQMVKSLHAAGIEVIMDVVYNHTAEGNHLGPTLSFKGIDNASYYRRVADSPRHDGFTLRDLVSYNDKHNEANGEDGNDGDNNNHSWNCGAEGPTDDEAVQARRSTCATGTDNPSPTS